ncbi:MAG: Hsp20/alpha crystallin family protein [Planctomycetes bacterium]|nr:Hsp20/alpha crystallin family protein [Planctomycetota bacterium]
MSPFEDSFDELVKSMEAVMGGMSSPSFFNSSGKDSWDPRVNVYELADRIVICVELAGIQPGELDVQVHEGILHIRGHRGKPTIPDASGNIGVHLMEIDSGKFHRKIPVPGDINFDQSKANYKTGFVWISLPRRSEQADSSE